MLILWFCAALVVALLFPRTPAGKFVMRLLVEAPAKALAGLTPARLTFAFLVALAAVAIVVAAKAAGLIAIAQALPDGLAWFAAFDMASYLDAIALVWLLAATVRLRTVWNALRSVADCARQWTRRGIAFLRARTEHGSRRHSHRSRPRGSRPFNPDGDPWPALVASAG